MSKTAKPAEVVIDELSLVEWVEHGLAQLEAYLAKWALFDEYLLEHPRPE